MVFYEQIRGAEVISLHSNDVEFVKEQQNFLRRSPQIEIPNEYDKNTGVYKKINTLSVDLCDKVLNQIKEDFKYDTFMKVNYGYNRDELIINLNRDTCADIYKEVYEIIKSQIPYFKNINCMTGLLNKPETIYQPIHTDFDYDKAQCIFIALNDTTKDMGPTLVIPGTNNKLSTEQFLANKKMISKPFHEVVLKKGEALVMDVNVLHCGTPNNTRHDKWILTLTYTIY